MTTPVESRCTRRIRPFALSLFVFVCAISLSACHSYHIDATITNHTGGPISLLEVDYPSASFGADSIAAEAAFHYRIQTRGDGPIKLQYTTPGGKQIQVTGPTLYERQEGQIHITLLADGKVDFHHDLNPRH